MMAIVALIQEKDSLIGSYVTTHVGGTSTPLDRWMKSCGFELYPNLKWETVMSYHGSNRPAMTIFVPFAVENNWAVWNSPDVDDSDFHGCPTSCVWIRSRDTSMQGLGRNAQCAAEAHAVLFWLPLGHPYTTDHSDAVEAIKSSGLIHSSNQMWVGVGTEPGMMNSIQGSVMCQFLYLRHLLFQRFSMSLSAMKKPARCGILSSCEVTNTTPIPTFFFGRAGSSMCHCCRATAMAMKCDLDCESQADLRSINVEFACFVCDRIFVPQVAQLDERGQRELISRLPSQHRNSERVFEFPLQS
jgi:hypothetical protein